jgi:hypothetical protein
VDTETAGSRESPQRAGVAPGVLVIALVVGGLVAAAAPARADWLVTRDGDRIETKGPWRVEGRRVLFTLPNGTLASLRSAQVDFDASAAATVEAQEALVARPEIPAPDLREPIVRLTDADFSPAAEDFDENGEPLLGGAAAGAASDLVVASWERLEDEDGVVIVGMLQNRGTLTALSILLVVELYDADGALIANQGAALDASALAPRDGAGFRAEFPGIFEYAALRFDVRGRTVETEADPAPLQPFEQEPDVEDLEG